MGCDIHVVLEQEREEGGYVGIWFSDYMPERPIIKNRDYALFAEFANVRGDSVFPHQVLRGFPEDASELSRLQYEKYKGDHHSPNWLYLNEAIDKYRRTRAIWDNGSKLESESFIGMCWRLFGVYTDDVPIRMRIVFWFDN